MPLSVIFKNFDAYSSMTTLKRMKKIVNFTKMLKKKMKKMTVLLKITSATFVRTILMSRKALRSTPYQSTWIGFKRVELNRRLNQESEVSHMPIVAGLIIV